MKCVCVCRLDIHTHTHILHTWARSHTHLHTHIALRENKPGRENRELEYRKRAQNSRNDKDNLDPSKLKFEVWVAEEAGR